jgi:hypothetical protein
MPMSHPPIMLSNPLPVKSFHLYLCEKCVLNVSGLATSIAFMSAGGI